MEDMLSVFQDVPVIMIHKGWQSRQSHLPSAKPLKRKSNSTPPVHQDMVRDQTTPRKQFAFINSTKPGCSEDPEVRKLIRRHVRNEFVRLKGSALREEKRTNIYGLRDTDLLETPASNLDERWSGSINFGALIGYPTESSSYPIDMDDATHALLSHYLTYASKRMFPVESCLKSNPFRSPEWLHFAVTDSAMFHAVLYAAAVYLALIEGKKESRDTIHHQNRTVSIIQQRLADTSGALADATLGAISCLAMGEAISGNENLWRLHMKGLKNMMLTRNNLSSLSPLMMAKFRRSDITGAIDYAAAPLLQFERSGNLPIWSIFSDQRLMDTKSELSCVLTKSEIDVGTVKTMVELAYFTQTISLARSSIYVSLDPTAFAEDLYWIEHSLLSSAKSHSSDTFITRACRVGGLLYVKGILQEFPHSATGSSILTKRLQYSLDDVCMTENNVHLLTWLAAIGAMVSKSQDRSWFIMFLNQSTHLGRVESLGGALPLNRFLDLRTVFGSSLDNVWAEILSNRSLVRFTEPFPDIGH